MLRSMMERMGQSFDTCLLVVAAFWDQKYNPAQLFSETNA